MRLTLTLAVLFAVLSLRTISAPPPFKGFIRVGLKTSSGIKAFSLVVTGGATLTDVATSQPFGTAEPGPLAFRVTGNQIVCPALGVTSSTGIRLETRGGQPFQIGERSYPGVIELRRDGTSLLTINEVKEEDYVVGSLLIEGGSRLSPEALKALAVAIRTFGERSRGKHDKGLYDVCDTTHCQGYLGLPKPGDTWAIRAAKETEGETLTWDGQPIWSLYSTDCGGATANNEDQSVGEPPCPYLRAVSSVDASGQDFCKASPYHHWTQTLSSDKIEKALNARPLTRIGRLTHIAIEKTDRYGRAILLRAEGVSPSTQKTKPYHQTDPTIVEITKASSPRSGEESKGGVSPQPPEETTNRLLRATVLRSMLGESVLKSTFFTVTQEGTAYRFEGRGYGHGVGMCMAGAEGMAKAGFSYREILSHYYSGAPLSRHEEPIAVLGSAHLIP